MQYTLSTAGALIAALSLTSAAPMPSSSTSGSSSGSVNIVLQLQGFDAASTLRANLDATTVNNRDAKSAALQEAGPWCAGFTDAQATLPVPALNGDGIFDSENEAIYSKNDAVTVGSFWCAQTRKEVETFVARATGGQGNNNNNNNQQKNNNGNGNQDNDNDNDNEAPANNGNGNGNGNGAGETVRVQIELEASTTFVQAELPANVGNVDASEVRNLAGGAISIEVVGNNGDCTFFDAQGRNANFDGSELVAIASFNCQV